MEQRERRMAESCETDQAAVIHRLDGRISALRSAHPAASSDGWKILVLLGFAGLSAWLGYSITDSVWTAVAAAMVSAVCVRYGLWTDSPAPREQDLF